MFSINRDAVILKGKHPLVDWINSHDPDNPVAISAVRTDCRVYLLPECIGPDEAKKQIEANFDVLFENELVGWYTDESMWPQNRTVGMFRDWFEIEYHSMVTDVLMEPILKEIDWD